MLLYLFRISRLTVLRVQWSPQSISRSLSDMVEEVISLRMSRPVWIQDQSTTAIFRTPSQIAFKITQSVKMTVLETLTTSMKAPATRVKRDSTSARRALVPARTCNQTAWIPSTRRVADLLLPRVTVVCWNLRKMDHPVPVATTIMAHLQRQSVHQKDSLWVKHLAMYHSKSTAQLTETLSQKVYSECELNPSIPSQALN